MTRPIVWALGTFVLIGLGATSAGTRLSQMVRPETAVTSGEAVRPVSAETMRPPRRETVRTEEPAPSFGGTLVIAGDARGHFRASTTIDGRHLSMLVDTGASLVILSAEDADTIGIRPLASAFTSPVSTVNGTILAAPIRLRELRVGDITVRDVEALVVPRERLWSSLLGMSFLRRLRGFEIAGNRLTLKG